MNLEEREAGLLRLIAGYQEDECHALLDAAQTQASAILAHAWREGRDRLHACAVAQRAGAQARIQAGRAERDTRIRTGDERTNARLLALALPRLRERLAARWARADTRRDWALGALAQARRVLPRGAWTVRHAPGGEAGEWQPLAADLTAELGVAPGIITDPALTAGLTIAGGGAVLDASLEALMRDRTRLEARLLALLAEPPAPAPTGTPTTTPAPSAHSAATGVAGA